MSDVEEEENSDEETVKADGSAGQSTKPLVSKDALKVYVGGLPFSCSKTEVREHFSRCGEIDWLHMPLDAKERHRGIAFISFWAQESVDTALKLNGTHFGEHVIKVNMAGEKPEKVMNMAGEKPETVSGAQAEGKKKKISRDEGRLQEKVEKSAEKSEGASKDKKVFIGGVPFKCSAETLKKDFSECGPIQQLKMPIGEDGKSKGIAFVTFATKEGVVEALKFHDTDYGGCKLTVRMASEKVEKGKLKGVPRVEGAVKNSADGERNPLEVIVKGLAFGTNQDVLKEALLSCGVIDAIRMPLNKKGKSYGFAFVAFQEKKGMKKALKLSGSEINGRPCTIERLGEVPSKQSDTEPSKKRKANPPEETDEQEAPKGKAKKNKVAE